MKLADSLRSLADRLDADDVSIDTLIQTQFALTEAFEVIKPGRPWTPDGHFVGSIGETFAEEHYGIRLDTPSAERHDGEAPGGRAVQIKLTQGSKVALSSEPDYLLVFQLHRDGTIEEVFNGPGSPAWKAVGKMQKNGQASISLSRLRDIQKQVPEEEKIPQIVAST